MGGTSGPDVPILKRFQSSWETIDQTKFATLEDEAIRRRIQDDEILTFAMRRLQVSPLTRLLSNV